MAKYTTQIRSICEVNAGLTESKGFDDIENIITKAAPKIFGTNWPIFDEDYRLVLEKLILRHYYTREICEETVGLWMLRLIDKLNLIMPYYNKLYESEKIKFDPLNDTDYTDTGNRKGDTKSTNNGEQITDRVADTSDWQLYSDTPQGSIIGIANATGSIGDNSYLTNAQHNTGNIKDDTNVTTNNSGTVNSVEDYTEHIIGKRGVSSYSKMLLEFRETFININMQIINELSDLFFGLWE